MSAPASRKIAEGYTLSAYPFHRYQGDAIADFLRQGGKLLDAEIRRDICSGLADTRQNFGSDPFPELPRLRLVRPDHQRVQPRLRDNVESVRQLATAFSGVTKSYVGDLIVIQLRDSLSRIGNRQRLASSRMNRDAPKGVFIKHPLRLERGVVTPSRVRRGTFTSRRGMTVAKSYGRNPARGASLIMTSLTFCAWSQFILRTQQRIPTL